MGNATSCILTIRSKQIATRECSVTHFRAQMVLLYRQYRNGEFSELQIQCQKWSLPIHSATRSQSDTKDNESVWSGYGADLVGGSGSIKVPGKFMYPKEALFPQAAPHGKRHLGTARWCCFQAIRWFPAQSFHQLSSEWFKAHLMKLNIKHQIFHKHRYWKHHGNEQLRGWLAGFFFSSLLLYYGRLFSLICLLVRHFYWITPSDGPATVIS